jgi:hypothetical protein
MIPCSPSSVTRRSPMTPPIDRIAGMTSSLVSTTATRGPAVCSPIGATATPARYHPLVRQRHFEVSTGE